MMMMTLNGNITHSMPTKITFEGSEYLQTKLKALVLEFIDVFATKVRRTPADVEPMKISVDEEKWRLPCNRAPPRRHSEEKQKEIRKQVDALLSLGVIKESQASEVALHFGLCATQLSHRSIERMAHPQYSADHQQNRNLETQGVWHH